MRRRRMEGWKEDRRRERGKVDEEGRRRWMRGGKDGNKRRRRRERGKGWEEERRGEMRRKRRRKRRRMRGRGRRGRRECSYNNKYKLYTHPTLEDHL